MTSGNCRCILRSCSAVDTRARVSLRRFCTISHIFYVKIDSERRLLDILTTCPLHLAVTCVSVSPKEYKKVGLVWEMTT